MQHRSRITGSAVLAGAVVVLVACHGRRDAGHAAPRDTAAARTLGAHAGATTTIESAEIEQRHALRFMELLQGQPGVLVTQQGDYVSVRIRGAGTVYGSGEPLYVLDGTILGQGANGSLMSLSTSDIARIEILRDAGTTAMYGSRGANGVIVVTTKRERTRSP